MNRWHGGPTWHGNNCTAITDMVLAGINRNIQPPNEISKTTIKVNDRAPQEGRPGTYLGFPYRSGEAPGLTNRDDWLAIRETRAVN